MKVAALDLGTNTFLCLIAEVSALGIEKVYQDLVQVVRLGQEMNRTNTFQPEALQRAEQTLKEFKKQIDIEKVDRILAMATSAARDATNGEKLLEIGSKLGIPIEIIPGSDEARITYKGAIVGHDLKNQSTLVVDVGGGSTELILGRGENLLFAKSLDIGGVRLTEKFISAQPIAESERKSLQSYIDQSVLESMAEINQHSVQKILAVAGTPTSIAAIELGGFVENQVDGFKISLTRLLDWQKIFAETTVEEKKQRYGLGGRADIIYVGVSILISVLKASKLNEMTVSTKGVRYGVAMEILAR